MPLKHLDQRHRIAALLLALPGALLAAAPDIQPGQWEYTNTTGMSFGGSAMPPQQHVHRECLTQADLQELSPFDTGEMGECTLTRQEQSASRLRYEITCQDPASGGTYTLQGDIRLQGTRMEGTLNGKMDTPMGPATLEIALKGQRIGDC